MPLFDTHNSVLTAVILVWSIRWMGHSKWVDSGTYFYIVFLNDRKRGKKN